jgi:hypothetical protein
MENTIPATNASAKTPLHGPGVYYFGLKGARNQSIFQSVFEYDYAIQLFAELPGCTLLAYTFFDDEIHCVLHSERDWPLVFDDIREAFTELNNQVWETKKPVLSEQCTVLMVDEPAWLQDLVIHLHQLPVIRRLVADTSVYAWSSDHHYRSNTPPPWLDTGRMLNLLCQTRHQRSQRYSAVMAQSELIHIDLMEGTHPTYLALAREAFVDYHQRQSGVTASQRSEEELNRLKQDALKLISDRFDITIESLCDRLFRRQYQRLMPLVAWLLKQRDLSDETIADLLGEDESIILLWRRGVNAEHAQTLLEKLTQLWQPTVGAHVDTLPKTDASLSPSPAVKKGADIENTAVATSELSSAQLTEATTPDD